MIGGSTQFARLAVATASRRGMVGILLGSLLLGVRPVAAKRKGCGKVDQKCKKNGDCCKGAACQKGKCRCKPGKIDGNGDGVCGDPVCHAGSHTCEVGGTPCCPGSECKGKIGDTLVCCGVSLLHECDLGGADPAEFCCSGICDYTKSPPRCA